MNEKQHGQTIEPSESQECAAEEHCITCADKALPAMVLTVNKQKNLALVQTEGMTVEVDIALVEAVLPGDVLLIHGGVAIARL